MSYVTLHKKQWKCRFLSEIFFRNTLEIWTVITWFNSIDVDIVHLFHLLAKSSLGMSYTFLTEVTTFEIVFLGSFGSLRSYFFSSTVPNILGSVLSWWAWCPPELWLDSCGRRRLLSCLLSSGTSIDFKYFRGIPRLFSTYRFYVFQLIPDGDWNWKCLQKTSNLKLSFKGKYVIPCHHSCTVFVYVSLFARNF